MGLSPKGDPFDLKTIVYRKNGALVRWDRSKGEILTKPCEDTLFLDAYLRLLAWKSPHDVNFRLESYLYVKKGGFSAPVDLLQAR